ncbi:MAG: exodeoxyribonuclease VII small subunit [Thermoguttaceae bacterium]|nr:exodeoxyribonuclease VII small subunit [Thermoguttaceae bacterium]
MTKQEPKKKLSFEESLARLEEIVSQLEQGRLDLLGSLACYEEGVGLLGNCQEVLDDAKRRICILRGVDENGKPLLEEANADAFESDGEVPGRQTKSNRKTI